MLALKTYTLKHWFVGTDEQASIRLKCTYLKQYQSQACHTMSNSVILKTRRKCKILAIRSTATTNNAASPVPDACSWPAAVAFASEPTAWQGRLLKQMSSRGSELRPWLVSRTAASLPALNQPRSAKLQHQSPLLQPATYA